MCVFYVDRSAFLKFFQKEPRHEQVARLLEHAHRARTKKLLCAINPGEIIHITRTRRALVSALLKRRTAHSKNRHFDVLKRYSRPRLLIRDLSRGFSKSERSFRRIS